MSPQKTMKRRMSISRSNKNGGSISQVISQALVPFVLVGISNRYHKMAKTRKYRSNKKSKHHFKKSRKHRSSKASRKH